MTLLLPVLPIPAYPMTCVASMRVTTSLATATSRRFSRFATRRSSIPAGRFSRIFNTSGSPKGVSPNHQAKRCQTPRCGGYGRQSTFEVLVRMNVPSRRRDHLISTHCMNEASCSRNSQRVCGKNSKTCIPFYPTADRLPIGQSCGVSENNEALRRPYFLLRQVICLRHLNAAVAPHLLAVPDLLSHFQAWDQVALPLENHLALFQTRQALRRPLRACCRS